MQCVAVCCTELQWSSVVRFHSRQEHIQRAAVCCNDLALRVFTHVSSIFSAIQYGALWCTMLHCIASSRQQHLQCIAVWCNAMGWLRIVGSIKLWVSFAEYWLFCRALLQKRPIILSILLTKATPYGVPSLFSLQHYPQLLRSLLVHVEPVDFGIKFVISVWLSWFVNTQHWWK